MNELQTKLTEGFKWFHEFCVANNLRYFAVGGTMLGAVRHKGFIPWDDDIDVAMPRPDYERLREIAKTHKDDRFYIEFPGFNKEFYYLYAKVFDKSTTLIEDARKPIKRGFYIDVFPLDGVGDDIEEAKENYKPISKKINLYSMITCNYSKRRKGYKNFAVFLGRIISPLFVSRKKLANKLDMLCKKHGYDESKVIGNLYGAWGAKEIMPKDFMGTPTEIEFEGMKIYGVEKPHEYLTTLYKDYMTLPPEDKRVSHHDHLEFNAEKPYLED